VPETDNRRLVAGVFLGDVVRLLRRCDEQAAADHRVPYGVRLRRRRRTGGGPAQDP
jgi:hypothetical protein